MRALRLVLAATLLIVAAVLGACGLTIVGAEIPAASEGGPPPPPPPTDDAGGDDSGASGDDSGASGLDAGCGDAEAATFVAPTLRIHPATRPVTVDGDLSEWACAKFFTLDKNTAEEIHLDAGVPNSYAFALAYDTNELYVAVRATDAPPLLGNVTPDVYNNDAVELFLGGDATFNGIYSSIDHQYVVDWKNRTAEYRNSGPMTPSAAFVSAVKTNATGYVVEVSIGASEFGKASFASGAKLGWTIAGDNSNGTAQDTWMNWFKPGGVTCSGCCSIYCNTFYYATLSFGP